jgi:hypothetical protein
MKRERMMYIQKPNLSNQFLSRSRLEDDPLLHVDKDIVGRVSVKRLLEQLLVEVMTDETDRSTENEKTVKSSTLEVIGSLVFGKGTTSAEEITEGSGDSTIDVENEGV